MWCHCNEITKRQDSRQLSYSYWYPLPGRPPETLTAEIGRFPGQCWHLDLRITCADKDLCRKEPTQPVRSQKFIFFVDHQNILPLIPIHIVHEKAINLSVWVKEIRTLLVKIQSICSNMQRVNLHARPSVIQVGCPTCFYQVCALDHAKEGTADLAHPSEPCHRNGYDIDLIRWYQLRHCPSLGLSFGSEWV